MNHFSVVGIGHDDIDAVLPVPLTLEWWAPGCGSLPPGRYLVTTLWDFIEPPFPIKLVEADSNIFEVRP